ncbi:phosphoenolpyruvate carboxylase, partial [Patescibacteria group bacterium]|nr:phosphoenolpyruvate carboxylase [Patescibacteria group bacterium]
GLLEKLYLNLDADLTHAGKYLNKENLSLLAKKIPILKKVEESVRLTEKYLGKELGPYKHTHLLHRNLTSNIYHKMQLKEDFSGEIEQAAAIRHSLG